ncbi:MAG TPA: DnaJ domain-containing protein [Pseudolabrys sp.]|nr:DnaJ domain-containing protein [Pseudolabrys sp.]
MPALIFGVLVLVLVLWALNIIAKADPKVAARVAKVGGGLLSLGFAVFLGLRGEIGIALPLGAFGLGLLGWLPFGPAGFSARTQKTSGQTSRVRSAYFEMELDHDSGIMRGRVVAGPHRGAELDRLDLETLAGLLDDADEESRALLIAYLDRQRPGWSEHAQSNSTSRRRSAGSGKMSEQEAYQILGLEPGASAEDISRAHRTLMKKLHPDQGGSTYLAARINEAKEILLRRHR